jgi:PAS domain S-box-containing protein
MNPAEIAVPWLAAIVQSSDDAIVSKDLNGTVITWNPAAERMFGFTPAEAIGQSIRIIIPADRHGEEDEVIARIRRGESVEHYETLRQHKSGALIPISLTVSPIRNAAGVVIGASKVARDISERRAAEVSLAEARAAQEDLKARLVALVAASGTLFGSPSLDDVLSGVVLLARALVPADGCAVWRLDPGSDRQWHIGASDGISDEFARRIIRSYRGEPATLVPFTEPLVAETVQTMPLLAERLDAYRMEGIESMLAVPLQIAGLASGTLVFYFRRPHRFSDVEVQTARALGNLSAAAVTTAELHETQRRIREQAERGRRQSEFLAAASAALASSLDYQSTLRTVAGLAVPHIADWCAVDVIDEHDEVQRVAVTHVDPEKIELARTFQMRFPETADAPSSLARAIRSGEPFLVRDVPDALLAQTARSQEHLVALRELAITSYMCAPLIAHGRTFGAITFVSAESNRHYTDEDLRFAQDVAYRSALAVENARVYAQASTANRVKDEFLATLSHELRTPLNAVLGWVRMLRAGAVVEAKVPRALEVIEHNAGAQLRLVEDLLDLSRIITGKFRLEIQPVHLAASVDAAVSAIQPAATAKQITIEVITEAGVGAVAGDAQRLQQAVWNLLSNSIKFTPAGGHVRAEVREHAGEVTFEIEDSGEGIGADVLPFVFDRFRQGESGSTRSHMGLGLGLAIVRHIVELHGGRVEVHSPGVGQGATFRFALPSLPSRRPGDENRLPSRPATGTGTQGRPTERDGGVLAGVRVLVVDDDPDDRELLDDLLRYEGLIVRRAGSVTDALAEIDREPPDVIVRDIAMPGHDGHDLIRCLREHGRGLIPAVALSAYADPEDRQRSLEAGYVAHLPKPVDPRDLLGAIVDAIANAPPPQPQL